LAAALRGLAWSAKTDFDAKLRDLVGSFLLWSLLARSIKASKLVVCSIFDSQMCNFSKMFLRLRRVLEF
jgi:hypothetical protein